MPREVRGRTFGDTREFTTAEIDQIAELTAEMWPSGPRHDGLTSSIADRALDEIFAAAGWLRGFRLWPLGGGAHDPERAFDEEVHGDRHPITQRSRGRRRR
ncbi:hypothetical protein [Williamsia sp. 1135]|uniref:hypothetical protein n=1 Tax=Williamsia sp. 1135 TaxID=1889262 RepID=UPI000A0F9910|nr:hypothetical protein [Williamsia sp. 1135]ORM29191.1 hypothetical protein BFL43_20370 [Williamsia sp. 1135]